MDLNLQKIKKGKKEKNCLFFNITNKQTKPWKHDALQRCSKNSPRWCSANVEPDYQDVGERCDFGYCWSLLEVEDCGCPLC